MNRDNPGLRCRIDFFLLQALRLILRDFLIGARVEVELFDKAPPRDADPPDTWNQPASLKIESRLRFPYFVGMS